MPQISYNADYFYDAVPDIVAGDFPVLGQGVWGTVLDLQDGTVLKLSKRDGGVGDGVKKLQRECRVMQHLKHHHYIPDYIADGQTPENTRAYQDGLVVWSRMQKILGAPLALPDLEAMSAADIDNIARNIGTYLAQLHQALNTDLPHDFDVFDVEEKFKTARHLAQDTLYHDCIDHIQHALTLSSAESPVCFIHGDFNISNIMFDNNSLVGILDFAETCCHHIEKDISDILDETPYFEEALLPAYHAESGTVPQTDILNIGFALNALYGALIGEYRRGNDAQTIAQDKDALMRAVAKLKTSK